MTWGEFCTLLSGLNGETPLGSIVSIRAETDKDVIKRFTPAQRKIRSEWNIKNAKKQASKITEDEYKKSMQMLEMSLAKEFSR